MGLYYNVSFEVAGILMLLLLLTFIWNQYGTVRTPGSRAFMRLVVLILIAECFDVLTACMSNSLERLPYVLGMIANTLYFGSSAVCEFLLVDYVGAYTKKGRMNVGLRRLNEVVLVAYLLVLLVNIPYGLIFVIQDGVYLHGSFHILSYIVPAYYLLTVLVVLANNRQDFTAKQIGCDLTFVGFSVAGLALQAFFFPNTLLAVFGATLGALVLFFAQETPDYVKLVRTMDELEGLRAHLQEEVEHQTSLAKKRQREVEELTLETVRALASAIDAKDEYTNGHSNRVSTYSVMLARELGWNETRQENLGLAALLHDVGKIGVPDSVLNKPTSLSEMEFQIIRSHPTVGAEILKHTDNTIPGIVGVVKYHHERWDGKGYPEGLAGEDIPLPARMVGIADAFDAMTSDRVYRRAMSLERVREELVRGCGTQFDPELCQLFVAMVDRGDFTDLLPAQQRRREQGVFPLIKENFQRAQEALEASGYRDSLTGLLAREQGEERIRGLMGDFDGCLMLFDVDDLQALNRTYGYRTGDAALKALAESLMSRVGSGVACRLRGGRFMAFVPEMSPLAAQAFAADVLESFAVQPQMNELQVTASAGLCCTSQGDSPERRLAEADKALYHTKQSGKGGAFLFGGYPSSSGASADPIGAEAEVNLELTELAHLAASVEGVEGVRSDCLDAKGASGQLGGDFALEGARGQFFSRLSDCLHGQATDTPYGTLVMITLEEVEKGALPAEDMERALSFMETAVGQGIRSGDIWVRYSSMQVLIALFGVEQGCEGPIIERVLRSYYRCCDMGEKVRVSYGSVGVGRPPRQLQPQAASGTI